MDKQFVPLNIVINESDVAFSPKTLRKYNRLKKRQKILAYFGLAKKSFTIQTGNSILSNMTQDERVRFFEELGFCAMCGVDLSEDGPIGGVICWNCLRDIGGSGDD